MPTREQIIEKLRSVMDPELNMSVVELGMVKEIRVEGTTVHLSLALTIPGCPMKDRIQRDAAEALKDVPGVKEVRVVFTAMAREELEALRQRLGAQRSAAINSGQATPAISRLPKKVPAIVAVTSGKGGVGKSSVTSMLAVALQRMGKKVGVLDADITGPSIARIFGTRERPDVKDEQVMIPVATESGVRILSINLLLENETTAVIWRGPMINGVIRQLYEDAAWEGLDVLFLDMPPGTSDANLTVFQSIPLDGVLVVASPQDLVKMVVAKSVAMARQMNIPILGLVENMAFTQCPKCGEKIEIFGPSQGAQAASEMGLPFLGSLPLDPALARACDSGSIASYHSPELDPIAGRLLRDLAKLEKV